ncbi:MAG: Hsp70 family protein, partial [Muribaculaceae bacterium]|nr:Hsp70 family protein [Muribaculaceae bacterium]
MDKTRAVYGIDLGTTYSCIAQVDRFDQAVVLRNFEGDSTTPSAVYFEDADHVVVGKEAKAMLVTEPDKSVVFVKREIGIDKSFDKSTNQFPHHYDPSEISAFILKKLVQDANDLGDNPEPVKDVVITCPAYFGTKERMQTKQAGEIA